MTAVVVREPSDVVPPAADGYAWSLGLVYLVTFVVVLLLYFPCRWYADRKARRSDTWLQIL